MNPGVIAGAAAGAVLVVIAGLVAALMFCIRSRCSCISNKTSETGSSNPLATVELNRRGESSTGASRIPYGPQGAIRFALEELELATKQFDDGSLIGCGSFGPVYKGLLHDTVVAVKRQSGSPSDELVAEVTFLSQVRHRNLVTFLGYCEEGGSQMLVFEYVPNGSLCRHLYSMSPKLRLDPGHCSFCGYHSRGCPDADDRMDESSTKLEFKQRLSIALGAAKGLCQLHSLGPPVVHKNFKTSNVLVDENFIVTVADVGISGLVERIEEAGPSHTSRINAFKDPEVAATGNFTEKSDVYSFGVFLLELITGQEDSQIKSLGSYETLLQWVASKLSTNTFIDSRLKGRFTTEGMRDLIRLALKCMSFPSQGRPNMEMVAVELERIHEKEMALTTFMGEETASIIKGSELFS